MVSRFRIPIGLGRRLDELGVSRAEVLRQAGLPAGLFDQDKALVTTEEFFAFYRGVEAISSDPAIGIALGSESRFERYDPVALAAVSARSFRDALVRVGRYKLLTCPEEIEVIEQGEECRVRFRWLRAEDQEPPLLVDLCFAFLAGIVSRGLGEKVLPRRLELRGPARGGGIHAERFGCAVAFEQERNTIVYTRADLDRPFVTHNAELYAALAPQLEAELQQALASRALGDQVKGILKRQLAGRRPGIAEVARELRLSPRTLQRRLTGDGLSFQQLLQEARRELARHYLLHSELELTETAYLLGYEDAHSFFRAFQGWEGSTPGEFRCRRAAAC